MKENSSNKKFTFLISENTYEDDSSSGSPYFAPPVDAPSPTFQEKEENPSSENTGDNASDNQHQSQPQENPSGSSQSGLYAVIQKGTAKCSFGTTPCGFKVSSHTLQHANGETTEHLIVTEEDVTFAKPAAPFTSCKADRNNPCSYAPDGKWQNTYSKIKVLGKKILTEESFLFCKSRSGKIEVKEHGQSQEVINAHFDNVELEELQMLSPLAGKPEDRKEIPQVKNIEVHLPQRKGDDAICKNTLAKDNSTKFNSAPQITVRKDEPMTFKVSSYYNKKADKNKVSWKVFDGKNFDSEKLELLEKGEELKINFDTYGIYRVLAYGNPEKSKDARCIIHVEVAENKLVGEGMKAIGENFIGKKIARNFPVNVQPLFLFPPNIEEKSRLKMEVKYGTSHFNHIFTPETGVIFTPDSNGEYTVVTTYTQEDGTIDIKEVTYKTVSNSISEITAFPQSKYYRPGTTITFKLSKLKFGIIPDENTDLLGIENKDIKWKLNDDIAQQGSRTFTRTFSQTGKYIVEAYVNKADGKGNDTHSFEIKKNEVIGFKGVLSLGLIVGKSREIEVETLMQYNKALDGDVTWKSTTPGLRITSVSGAKATITADREIWLGAGILTAQLGGKSATILVFASKAEIKRWCFTDSHNLYKRYAGWGETINVVLESTPLISGEKVKLHLMEYDSPTDANYIKDLGEVAFNEKGIARTSFKTDDIKSTLNKLYFERGGYEMFFAIEKKTGGITFAETKEKTRAGKLSYYPEKTSEVTGNEKGKFLFIDSKKDVVEARYYDTQGNRLWKVLRYGEPVKVHIQTRNMAGTKVKWQIYQNIVKGEDKKVGPEQEFTIGEDETLRLNIDTNVLKNSIAESERKKIAMFYCIITEADGDKFKYPKDLAISQILDTKKVNFYHHLKLSEAPDHINELANNNAPLIIGEPLEMGGSDCGQKYCIKKGDKNELIREVNIRLAGFGGNVPTDEFTDRTEKMIKQFQRDYMKVPETGRICGNVLKAIDEFSSKYELPSGIWQKRNNNNTNEMLCPCGICTGFGKGRGKGEYNKTTKIEANHNYEYPGIHRSLLWSLKAVLFYLNKTNSSLGYSFKHIESGYRCQDRNTQKGRGSTNHMGKALDLHFNKNGKRANSVKEMEDIRLNIFNKYLGAKWDWKNKNVFNLESTSIGATSWVHYDVREFDQVYLKDKYFTKTQVGLNGESILTLARELGFTNTCSCLGVIKIDKNNTTCYCFNKGQKTSSCNGKGMTISKEDYEKESERLGVEVAMMEAIAKQESKRSSFWEEGQATILFERHKMWEYLKKDKGKTDKELEELNKLYPNIVNKSQGGYGKYSEQYSKLEEAKKIDYTTALKACSWGKFQVMGFNYNVSFDSPEDMEKAVNTCEFQQFKFFIGYLENTSGLIRAMKNKNWEEIARLYNGNSWRTINPEYANNIKKYYNEFKK